MNDKQAIIDKIIGDAGARAAEILAEAQTSAANIAARAAEDAERYRAENAPKAERDAKLLISRRKSVSELDGRKLVLSAKKEALDETFAAAGARLRADKKAYLKLIAAMLAQNAADGETVTVGAADKDVITADFIKKTAAKMKIGLKLSEEYGEFTGGIMLSDARCDKNLTLASELGQLREAYEGDICALLFGEEAQ